MENTNEVKLKVQKPYYQMNMWEKMAFNIKKAIKNKISNFHFSVVKFIIALVLIAILTVVVIVIISNRTQFPKKTPYDKTGFIHANELNKENLYFENDDYTFEIDYKTTHITLTDKASNTKWTSTPIDNQKKDVLTLWYASGISEVLEFGSYEKSVNYLSTKNFYIRENTFERSVEVLYNFGGKIKVDYTDFPKVIEKSRYETLILNKFKDYIDTLTGTEKTEANRALRRLESSYKLEQNEYRLDNGQSMTDTYINNLNYIFYEICGYTKDDLEYDNNQYGIVIDKTYPRFEVSIKYTLTDEGLDVQLINESIVDYEDAPLVYIDVLPYFGCGLSTDEGYALIPDGSGIILDFNSKRSYTSAYEARLYGTDYSITNDLAPSNIQKLSLGVYGMKVNDTGFINIAKSGAESCGVIYENSTKAKPYNTANYRYYYRECDYYWFSSLSQPVNITTWTNQYNAKSLDLLITKVGGDGNYSEMAKVYQQYLVKEGLLYQNDQTKDICLDLTLIGGYLEKKKFLGIPYEKVSSLTNTEEVKEIIDELLDKQITNINVIYEGFFNQGIKPTYEGKIDYNHVIGSRKKLKQLNSYLENKQLEFYPSYLISSAYTKENLNDKNLVKNIYGKVVARYDLLEPVYTLNTKTRPLYTLHIDTYQKTLKKITKELNKMGTSNIGFLDFGSELYGNYQNKYTYYKSDTINAYQEAMNVYSSNFEKVMTKNPNDYAFKYTTLALDVPFKGTDYQIVNYSVPFYQLVVSGYLDYSFEPFNLNDEYTFDYYKMKALEYASNISMLWTYKKTEELIGTEYDHYYSTYYKNWIDETVSIYQEMSKTKVYESTLVYHEIIDNNQKLAHSKYANGLEIIFNYTNEGYIYQGVLVEANSYKVVKEALNG